MEQSCAEAELVFYGNTPEKEKWICILLQHKKLCFPVITSANEDKFTPKAVCLWVFLLIGWFVNKITQKLLNWFPQNLKRGWVYAQNRLCLLWGNNLDTSIA